MRIAVFGGTGRTGSRLVAMALERGDSVCALARDTSRLPVHPRLTPITGDARDARVAHVVSSPATLAAMGR